MTETRDRGPAPDAPTEEIVFDHPLYRHAPAVSVGAGLVVAVAIAVLSSAPWWMPLLAFAVTASVFYRILRPRIRRPTIEDEI